ncbi:MAG: biotin--[Clostridia bacterium]|nr:biotin--[acetyl-CoA-carboxylase] ligase [Clostridia bacterium]
MQIIKLKKTRSTQDYIKKLVKKQRNTREDLFVVSAQQTGGKGTKGRSFSSNKGGVYLSYLNFHTGKKASCAFEINKTTSLAVIKTLLAFGVKAGIKWPNDIYVNGKKICGMLIENTLVGEYLDYSIIGIGLNVNNALEEELAPIATTINKVTGKEANLESVLFTLIYNLQNPEKVSLYDDYLLFLGQKISVISRDGTTFTDIIDGVLEDGRLLLKSGKILTAEEISIRDVN